MANTLEADDVVFVVLPSKVLVENFLLTCVVKSRWLATNVDADNDFDEVVNAPVVVVVFLVDRCRINIFVNNFNLTLLLKFIIKLFRSIKIKICLINKIQ